VALVLRRVWRARPRLARKDDKKNIEEEFADCIAWLCTLANINDVDLAAAITRKYLSPEAKDGVK